MDDNNTIEIALAADGGYFCGLLVTASSIAKYADKAVSLRFNILDGGISESDWRYLVEIVTRHHEDSSFNKILVDESLFMNYPKWNGNRMAYARLLLPEVLSSVDYVVYCDVDFLWLRDIGELWRERDSSIALIGTKDGAEYTRIKEMKWFADSGYPYDFEKYFCSGLCFFNLKYFREHGLIKKCEEILLDHPDINYPDQAALNIVTYGRTKILPREIWQRFTLELLQSELNRGVVIHYAGEVPWKKITNTRGFQFLSDTMLIWHKFNARIHGKSVWWSLRQHFSIRWIVAHRGACLLFRKASVNIFCRWLLFALRHPGVYDIMQKRARVLIMKDSTNGEESLDHV